MGTTTIAASGLLLSVLLVGCGDAPAPGAASATPTASAAAPGPMGAAPASGLRLSQFTEEIETPTGKIGSKLSANGPAAARLRKNPGPSGARNMISFVVFPGGTDPATVCESSSPGPTKKNEYLLDVTGEYDGDLKVGPLQSASSPSIMTLSKEDDGNVSSAAIGKPGFVVLEVTSVSADSVTVKVGNKPGGGYRIDGLITARICKGE